MKPGLQIAGLITILFILALAMGLTFGAGGAGGGASDVRSSTAPPGGAPSTAPRVVVVARGVSPSYLYQSSLFSSIPSYMLQPLTGVRVALTSLDRETFSFRERVPVAVLRTNSTGVAFGVVAPGNYSVVIGGPNFSVNTTLSLKVNSTTRLDLSVLPSAEEVKALQMVSPDTVMGVEPSARFSALLGSQPALATGFAELIGYATVPLLPYYHLIIENPISINATVLGTYPGPGGEWAVLSPSGYFPNYPTTSVFLIQFRPVLEVSSGAG